ncbi:hypothetical protein [Fodinicurvata sp. EGI_FJ10296]|uniref:hypothetical protein n=1 Tax=Fodinicurvata sp. EGI_FJ10296 TaxID=3231908 RepID=UPI0034546AE0
MTKAILLAARSAPLLLAATIVAGCQDFNAQVFEQELPRAETTALYCYRTLARADCYETEIEGWEDRLIGVREAYTAPVEDENENADGQAPSRGEPRVQSPPQQQPRPVVPTATSANFTGAESEVQSGTGRLPGADIPVRRDGEPLSLTR